MRLDATTRFQSKPTYHILISLDLWTACLCSELFCVAEAYYQMLLSWRHDTGVSFDFVGICGWGRRRKRWRKGFFWKTRRGWSLESQNISVYQAKLWVPFRTTSFIQGLQHNFNCESLTQVPICASKYQEWAMSLWIPCPVFSLELNRHSTLTVYSVYSQLIALTGNHSWIIIVCYMCTGNRWKLQRSCKRSTGEEHAHIRWSFYSSNKR